MLRRIAADSASHEHHTSEHASQVEDYEQRNAELLNQLRQAGHEPFVRTYQMGREVQVEPRSGYSSFAVLVAAPSAPLRRGARRGSGHRRRSAPQASPKAATRRQRYVLSQRCRHPRPNGRVPASGIRITASAYPAGRDDVGCMARTLSGGETPVELVAPARSVAVPRDGRQHRRIAGWG